MAPKPDLSLSTVTLFLLLALFYFLSNATAGSSSFKFLEHLKGCRKGDNVKGINDLKKYLHKFGYLNYYKDQIHSNDDGDFDELLEEAVKIYQLNFHLESTGMLDNKTITKMMMPRCGFPDIINGTSFIRSAKIEDHHHSIHTTVHYDIYEGRYKWPPSKYTLTYGFLPGTPSVAMTAIPRALETWAKSTHFKFKKAQRYEKADIKVAFYKRKHDDGTFDGPDGELAHADVPTGGKLHFDAEENWSGSVKPGAYLLETIALHEIGHILGLGHSKVKGAVMEPYIGPGEVKKLHQDDIQGIKALYKK